MIDLDKNIEKVIFDIDYTLLVPNYAREKADLFLKEIPNAGEMILERINLVLCEYEKRYLRYNVNDLVSHLNEYSEQIITREFIFKWIEFTKELDEQDLSETKNVLEYLKKKNISIVALTNWFTEAQVAKLKKAEILYYFDNVYGWDIFLKPNKSSFINAAGTTSIKNCLMVGDNYNIDIVGANKVGMPAILIDKNGKYEYPNSIKSLTKIKKII